MNKYVLLCLILVKLFFTLFFSISNEGKFYSEVIFSTTQNKGINNDEFDIANIADSYNKGFYFSRHVVTPDTSYYYKTAYRPFTCVLFHVFYQRFYNQFISPLKDADIAPSQHAYSISGRNLLSDYYILYAKLMVWTAFLLFIISIPFFKRILDATMSVSANSYVINGLLFLYILFPSSLIYIGLIPLYENIALPCLVIIISILIQSLNGRQIGFFSAVVAAFLTALVISIRPQTIIPLAMVFSYFGYHFIKRAYLTKKMEKGMKRILFFTSVAVAIIIGQTIYINYNLWNKITLSTRGDALLWGHNPLARGSWDAKFDLPGSAGYKYQVENIQGLLKMDEYESSKAKKKLAYHNIFSQPAHESWLLARKLAIFFLPYNFIHHHFNFITFITYAGFIFYCFYFVRRFKTEVQNGARTVCLIFVSGIIAVNVIFFVEYRIRYLAEPFFLILSACIFIHIWNSKSISAKLRKDVGFVKPDL